ncbi:MAG: secretin N-terminal domain-containing protein, partial [Tepidisphaeraceae bacterium]
MRRRQRQLLAASLLMGTAVSLSAPYVTGQAVPAPAVGPAPATQPVIVAATQPTTQPTTQPLVVATTQPTTQPTTRSSASTPHIVLQPGGRILLNFKEASIDSVLDELSAVAGYTIYRQVKPEGRVNLDSKGKPLSAEEAITALNMVLNDRGYAAIQQGRMLKIMTRDKARKANIPVRKGSDPKEIAETDELITQVIPLAYVDATQLKADLAPLVNPEADFTANASSNALIMTDTSANIRRVVEIVNELDKQLADATEVKVFQLKYASAANAAKLVNDLFGAQAIPGGGQGRGGGGGGQGRGGGGFGGFGGGGFGGGGFGGGGFGGGGFGGAPGGAPGAAAAAGGAQSSRRTARVTASSDDRTNTLVVTGPTAVLTVVAQVVKELDANPTSDDSVFVYRLKNAQSLNIEAVVNNLFNGTNMARGSSNSQTALPNRSSTLGGSSARTGSSGTGSTTANRSTGSSTSGFGGSSGRTGFGGASASTMNIASQLAGQVTIIADPDTNSLLVRTSPKNWDQVKDILKELDRPVAQVLIKVLIAEVTHDNETDVGAEFSALNIRASGLGQKGGTAFGQAAQAAAGNGASVQILETNFNA